MKERHQLLKTGGILLFFFGLAYLIYGIVFAVMTKDAFTIGGAILGAGVEEQLGAEGALVTTALGSAAGGFLSSFIMVFTIIAAALYILTGLLGFKGNSLTACKVLGIIMLVLAVIAFISNLGTIAVLPLSFVLALISLVLILIYVIGAFKSVNA